ncbi:hypothetical protein NQ314_010041 [Rhamnusium bicolor]|uniref:Uncharacterized protein n=1 Tax=Rhamnusium bicolor TaxID=1586634 RepID=A0AAV8XXU8_9CUCU|nr:hypothetical protein NQ314_010041 [Rhamnusium bicolor]
MHKEKLLNCCYLRTQMRNIPVIKTRQRSYLPTSVNIKVSWSYY